MKGARPSGTNIHTVVGQVSLGQETDVSEESRNDVVCLVRSMKGTRLMELLSSMFVSGHHPATTGVIKCVDQSYASVFWVPSFPHYNEFLELLVRKDQSYG